MKFSECQDPLCKFNPPCGKLSGDSSGSRLFTRQFSCVRFLPVWKSKKHANREPNSYTIWMRSTIRVLLVCVRYLQPW